MFAEGGACEHIRCQGAGAQHVGGGKELGDIRVHFRIEGPAQIAAVGNGNPLSLEPFQADYRKLFHGKAMLILRTKPAQTGEVQVTASSDGLIPAEATALVVAP